MLKHSTSRVWKCALGVNHSREPQTANLSQVESRVVLRIGKVEALLDQRVQRRVVDLGVVDEKIDRPLAPACCQVIDLLGGAAETR